MARLSHLPALALAIAALTAGGAPPSHAIAARAHNVSCAAGVAAPAVCDRALGVALTLPAGWLVAPPRQFTPGSLTLVTSLKTMAPRFSVQPLGVADTRYPAAAAAAGADALTQGMTVSIGHIPTTVAGTPAMMLLGMPGPTPNVQIVVAHGGALYDIVAFGDAALQPDQQRALSSLRFIPRTGPFPPAGTPQPLTAALVDPCLDLARRAPLPPASGQTPVGLHYSYGVMPARGNDMVVFHIMGTGVRPGERVTLTTCANTGAPPTYTRYQVTALAPTTTGNIGADVAFFVPSGMFDTWTVRTVAADTATGRPIATATRAAHVVTPPRGIRVYPRSRPAAPGRPYPFTLYTHCGVGYVPVDFDGALWDLADAAWAGSGGNPPPGLGNPVQDGTMTLVDRGHARFDFPRDPADPARFPGGHIHFTRHSGPRVMPGLCS